MYKTIFDLITAIHIAAYWLEVGNSDTHFTESLFPVQKQLGLDLKWIKGSKGLPVVLKPSAFDAAAIPRVRVGFVEKKTNMPHFKESMYIDEELRQELNKVIQTGNQQYIDAILNHVFEDQAQLLRGTAARREQMRCMLLTTGVIAMTGNGQNYEYDYQLTHKENAIIGWDDPDSDPLEDIRIAKETIQSETGEVLTRAMCDGLSWKNLRNHPRFKAMLAPVSLAVGNISSLTDDTLKRFIFDQVGLEVLVNYNRYKEEDGTTYPYVPANTFSMFPDGNLGNTWFGTTPAESDLMGGKAANVAIVDTGVSITTAERVDPVQVETIVAQICLPSFERADSIYILDTKPA